MAALRALRRLAGRFARPAALPPLILHLGDFKTGTTALQHGLGLHGAAWGLRKPAGFNQAALAQSLTAPGWPGPADAAFAALAEELAALGPGDPVVISAEHFELADPARLAVMADRHLPGADLRLVVYVRPHPAAFLARFAESTRIGSHDGPMETYLTRPDILRRMGYADRLGGWRVVWGDRLSIRLHHPSHPAGTDLIRDFRRFALGRDPGATPSGSADPATRNVTPGPGDLALARGFHRAIGPVLAAADGARHTLGRDLGRRIDRLPDSQKQALFRPDRPDSARVGRLWLHRGMARALADVFGADADRMDRDILPGIGGPPGLFRAALDDALATAPPDAADLEPATHLTPGALALLALWGAAVRDALARPDGPVLIDRLYHE